MLLPKKQTKSEKIMIYHVAKNGNDKNPGTAELPFLTISRAAKIAEEGDTVRVHEGIYQNKNF